MRVAVHQIDGVSTLQALPLAAGLLVAAARRDARLASEAALAIRTARVAPADAVAALATPDVIALSTYVWNERYSLELARRARALHPAAFIVLGGPSVPRRPERAAALLREHPAIDALALGEGEDTFRELLRALLDAAPLDGVAGLALRDRRALAGVRLTAPRERIRDFDAAASPYLDGTFDALLAAGAAPTAAILETNRGCPFACTYCDWGQAINSRVHELPLERLQGELAWIGAHALPYLYVIDANYGIRRRDLELVREMGRTRAATGAPRYVFFHLTKNATERHLELVLALRDGGIDTHLALSAQDFEPRVLEAVRRDNIKLERALALRRACHQRGVPTVNELILGLPEQSYDSFADSVVKAVTPWPGDAFQLYLARLLENAELASPEQRARFGLETRHVRIASFHHDAASAHVAELEEVVVATHALPVADWRRAFKLGYLLSAAHNLKLLDVVLQVAARQLPLRAVVERLVAALAAAPPGSALARVELTLERHAAAVLDGEAMVLPEPETGAHLWAPEDAVAVVALLDGERFYAEVAALFAAEPLVAEAVRFQRLVTPARGDRGARRARFAHDLAAWRRDPEAPLAAADVELTATPSAHLAYAPDALGFALAFLGLVRARLPLSEATGA